MIILPMAVRAGRWVAAFGRREELAFHGDIGRIGAALIAFSNARPKVPHGG
jgi:hypothetical protein